jgi:hypothetical protein
MPVMGRADQHEVGRRPADFGASHHQAKMRELDMLATGLKAVVHGHRKTCLVTAQAGIDAASHIFVHGAVPHRGSYR